MKLRTALLPVALTAALLAGAQTAGAAGAERGAPRVAANQDEGVLSFVSITTWEHIPAATRDRFIAAAQDAGYDALKHEPGTESAHVVPDPEHPDRVLIASTFLSEAAYQRHQQGSYERELRAAASRDGATGPNNLVANYNLPATRGDGRFATPRGDAGSVYTVAAVFTNVTAQYRDEFLKIAEADGYGSLTGEPGTLGFHAVPDPQDPTRFVFLETFTDKDAFYLHKNGAPAQAYLDVVAKAGIIGPDFSITESHTGFDKPGGWSVPDQDS
ncbi:putative quinol monooxygenase [Kitasatospora azatica]|uniref:putative quinol monooxygenase n=1 Tax=Kitasatospora azatica TaxID=58347 RepID=UPI000567E25D|nr:antibiotic biosynthesis monooxygenase [Kitasatospora azatica]